MWSEEGVLPTVALTEVASHVDTVGWVVWSAPSAIFHLWTDKLDVLVEVLLVVHSTACIEFGIFFLAHLLSHCSHAPVVYSIFHSYRSGFVNLIAWNKTEVHHVRHSLLKWIDGGSLHCSKCFFGIKSCEALEISIGNDWHCAIAWHTVGFAAMQCPYWQFIVLIIDRNHRIYEVWHHLVVYQSE